MTRQTRSDEIKTERRRRKGKHLSGTARKLHVNEDAIDRENYAHRWIHDSEMRMYNMTVNDDWDVVRDQDRRLVGEGERGEATRAVLVRKPIKYQDEDDAAKQRQIDEMENAIAAQGAADGEKTDGTYVPGERALTMDG